MRSCFEHFERGVLDEFQECDQAMIKEKEHFSWVLTDKQQQCYKSYIVTNLNDDIFTFKNKFKKLFNLQTNANVPIIFVFVGFIEKWSSWITSSTGTCQVVKLEQHLENFSKSSGPIGVGSQRRQNIWTVGSISMYFVILLFSRWLET